MLVNRLDQNDDGFPEPVTDPLVIENITAAYVQAVYEAKLELRARLAGTLPPPVPNRAALALLSRCRLHAPELLPDRLRRHLRQVV